MLIKESLQQRIAAALAQHQRGELGRAETMYREILLDSPRCYDALHLLGVAATERGALDEGIEFIRCALAVDDSHFHAHYHLARAYFAKACGAPALACVDRALALQPEFADAWFLKGNILQQSGRLEECLESYECALRLRPDFAEAWNNLAAALRTRRRNARAFDCVERALALQPAYPHALNNRGLILLDGHRHREAVDSFRQAVALNHKFAEALHNLGTTLMQQRRFAEARETFEQLAAVAPGFKHIQGNLLHARLNCCDWRDYDAATAAIAGAVERGEHADVPMSFLCVSGSAALQLRCAQTYTEGYFPLQSLEPAELPQTGNRIRSTQNRIRVAYLSGDFGEHAVTYLLAGVLERHDATRFETIALSWDRQEEGPARRRIQAAFSRFIDITAVSDAEVVRMMRELEVDIAVDLTAHTRGHRTGIFARRGAPVHVNYLGLPATMGARYMDYLIADRFLVPEEHKRHYAEQIVWLPVTYQPNDDRRSLLPGGTPRSEHGLPETGFVFCAFNNNCKFNPAFFDVWMRLIASVPGSVLWLLASNALAEDNLRREAVDRGVDAHRLVFAKRVPYSDYLARYVHADLFLDTLPFNGGATVSDALSMGVPVLACAGESFASRMAGGILSSLDLRELITHSLTAYESTALDLARSPARLRALRETLVQRRGGHAFFDTDCYRRHLESAYQMMWQRSTAGLPPAAFSVPLEGSFR